MKRTTELVIVILGLLLGTELFGADWPQFRNDAGRTAASPEELPEPLHLQWIRELGAPRPAFPLEVRLLFDASYEPVVAGKTMFVPSMVNDSVTALDTETGSERWRFYAEGPVRFAPVFREGKVYFVADDGYLYCLNAADGQQLWKFRGLGEGRQDRKLLGHGRLISLWPARGGPVLADGIIYFAAGLWPSDGVFVHALDAANTVDDAGH
jgi:outer membrane protein assembly factor BamB